jgi:hypothetical protein
MKERYITTVFMLRNRLVVSLKLTIMINEKRSLNCNIIASRMECFYSNAIGMKPLTEESEWICNGNDVFVRKAMPTSLLHIHPFF